MGVNQSLQALGRVLGPALGGWSYGAFGGEVCFAIAGFSGILGLIFIWQVYPSIPDTVQRASAGSKPTPTPAQRPMTAGAAPHRESSPAQPSPVVIPDRPRTSRPANEPPKVEHVRKEDRITFISAFQFRSLFTQNISFLFFDFRAAEAAPQYSRAVKVTGENVFEELNKRTQDKRIPILLLCEDGVVSKESAKKIADLGFINVVVVDGGARALNKTGHV
jgi:rhodanese-related sulfurtransferase